MVDRRTCLMDAAIRVLGSKGSRGLTHRSVDLEAGFPTGSTSNYFRSRSALITGIVARMEELDMRDWGSRSPSSAVESLPEFVELLTRSVVNATTTDRIRTRARYALVVEAALDGPDSSAAQSIERGRTNLVNWGRAIAGSLALPDVDIATLAIVDFLDGLILHELTHPPLDISTLHARIAHVLGGLASGAVADR